MPISQAVVAFIGHGSPLNALADNRYTSALRQWSGGLKKPEAIIVISAHWQTQGTWVSCQKSPKQIYDFYGFPEALYQINYPCPGAPEMARKVVQLLSPFGVHCSDQWGIDHAAWAVLVHLFPAAGIPVVEISLDMTKPPSYHYDLGQALRPLKNRPYLILGSGNMVHNLGEISWQEDAPEMAWAREMADRLRELLTRHQDRELIEFPDSGPKAQRGMPTLDHYLPMLYTLGMRENESKEFLFHGIQNGSIAMDSFVLGS